MGKLHTAVCVVAFTFIGGCDVPGPAQYDHAMLREYFGKSQKEVEATFGKPSSIAHADPQLPPENASEEERVQFNQSTESMRYLYSTVDGDLIFHFNLNGKVHAITYGGSNVSPPHVIPNAAKFARS